MKDRREFLLVRTSPIPPPIQQCANGHLLWDVVDPPQRTHAAEINHSTHESGVKKALVFLTASGYQKGNFEKRVTFDMVYVRWLRKVSDEWFNKLGDWMTSKKS